MKKKIIAITGARSDYDLLYTVYDKLDKDPKFDFSLIITGPNLSETFGYTAHWIEKDGFKIAARIFNLVDSSQKIGRIISIGHQIPVLANILSHEKPDIVLVAGDREESISVTMTCAYLDIVVAHFFGGDVVKDGNIDNSTRYAASKYAHIHFPSLEAHRDNLIKMGEEEDRIFVVGNPALDRINKIPKISKNEVFKELGLKSKNINKYCVLIQHSIITQVEEQYDHVRITLDAIIKFDRHCFINYPNSYPGSSSIIKAYTEYSNKYPHKFTLFKNLDRTVYINLLRNSDFLIGNSSSGLLEVASIKLAAINIGDRQRDRTHAENVIFVDNDMVQIVEAINKVLYDNEFKKILMNVVNPYGDGFSSDKIIKTLHNIKINSELIHKNITY